MRRKLSETEGQFGGKQIDGLGRQLRKNLNRQLRKIVHEKKKKRRQETREAIKT